MKFSEACFFVVLLLFLNGLDYASANEVEDSCQTFPTGKEQKIQHQYFGRY